MVCCLVFSGWSGDVVVHARDNETVPRHPHRPVPGYQNGYTYWNTVLFELGVSHNTVAVEPRACASRFDERKKNNKIP